MSTTPQRTSEGKWVIWERATGRRLERWPVDARTILASDDYVAERPENAEPEPVLAPTGPVDPVPHATAAAQQNAQRAENPTGDALVVTPMEQASPAAPVALPTGRTGSGKRGR